MESVTPLKVLIWAKTYPELSKKYRETVCTAGCLEDGTPVRIYPVSLRYLPEVQQYRLYDWIEIPLRRNSQDSRPESFRIAKGVAPRVLGHIGTEDGWRGRRAILFRNAGWHFGCAADLQRAQQAQGTSLGLIEVREVVKVEVTERPAKERVEHDTRMEARKHAIDLFSGGSRQLHLDFIPWRFRIHWLCGDSRCTKPHTASVLDWGLNELARREGRELAADRLAELCDLAKYDLRLLLGNLNSRRRVFSIVGLWYPLRSQQRQGDLFTP